MPASDYVTRSHIRLRESGILGLAAGAREGLHTLPAPLTDACATFEQLDPKGKVHPSPAELQAADTAADEVYRAINYQGPAIITKHLQPALTSLLDQFRADVTTTGHYGESGQVDVELLAEPEAVRTAYLRLVKVPPTYQQLRAAWQAARKYEPAETVDPAGTASALAEVADLPRLVPDWYALSPGQSGQALQSGPWSGSNAHAKLAWLVRRDAHIWLPTAAEQDQAWARWRATAVPTARVQGSVTVPALR